MSLAVRENATKRLMSISDQKILCYVLTYLGGNAIIAVEIIRPFGIGDLLCLPTHGVKTKEDGMKKLICVFVMLLIMLVTVTSCGGGFGGSGDQGGSGEQGGAVENGGQTFYYGSSEIMIISSSMQNGGTAASELADALNENILDTGRAFVGNIYVTKEYENQILVGLIPEKDASVEAYRLLDEMETDGGKYQSKYLIYSSGGTVCLAFEENTRSSFMPIDKLTEEFIAEYILGKDQLLLEDGIVKQGVYDTNALQAEIDAKYREEQWAEIGKMIGDEDTLSAVRAFFEQTFDSRIIPLIGELYDPASGMFYASTSGKRAEGIYPNPEATNQALSYLVQCLKIPKSLFEYLPDVVGYKIVYYVKSIQASDGEFYVAQLKKSDIQSNRIGNDRSSCLGLLNKFGASPTYSVSSYKGDGITADEYWANLVAEGKVTAEEKPIVYWAEDPASRVVSLSESGAAAVSRAVAASSVVAVSGSDQFKSHEAFVKWLLSMDGYNEPYTAMSMTLSANGLISDWGERLGKYTGESKIITAYGRSYELKKGETLEDILINWTNGYINDAGLFGKMTNGFVKDENGEYICKDGEYVPAEDGKGEYSPNYDGFFGGWGYQNTNGFHKAIFRYTGQKIPYPAPRAAAESLLKAIASDEPISNNSLVIYNVWSCLDSLRKNISLCYTGEDKQELLDLIDGTLRSKVVDRKTGETRTYVALALDKCLTKLLAFKKADGGFGHSANSGTGVWQGGLKVGLAADNLSDINAIACNASMGTKVCSVLGFDISLVPLQMETELNQMLDALTSQPYVTKAPPIREEAKELAPDVETFGEQPAHISYGTGTGSSFEITERDGGSVLHLTKQLGSAYFVYDGIGVREESPTVTVIGFDLLIENLTEKSGIEIYPRVGSNNVFLPYIAISGTSEGSVLRVYDHSSGMSAVDSGIVVGKWASIMIKYYAEEKKYDFYTDGNYIFTGSNLRWGSEYPAAEMLDGVMVAANSGNVGDFYFDNLYIHQLREN